MGAVMKMNWILYALLASFLLAGVLWATSSQEQKKAPERQDPGEFVPSERVPADSAVSFPVDI
jgi:hypothetical protein